jgi:hypothetical protein
MTLKELFTSVGITVTDQQFADISKHVTVKQNGNKDSGQIYSFRSYAYYAKTPTQMKVCVAALESLPGKSGTMEEWAAAAGNLLVTRQDPAKVIAFYRKRMIEDGLIVKGLWAGTPDEDPEEELEDEDQPDATEEEQEEFSADDDDEPEVEAMAPMDEAYQESRKWNWPTSPSM